VVLSVRKVAEAILKPNLLSKVVDLTQIVQKKMVYGVGTAYINSVSNTKKAKKFAFS